MSMAATSPSTHHSQLSNIEKEIEALRIEEWKEKEEETKQAPITDDELERFRREWREEVLAKRAVTAEARDKSQATSSTPSAPKTRSPEKGKQATSFEPVLSISTSPIRNTIKSPPVTRRPLPALDDLDDPISAGPSKILIVPPPTKIGKIPFRNPRVQDKDRAVQLYARAVESEQSGKLNDALMMYRKAFKLDDAVDKTYARAQANLAATATSLEDLETASPSSTDIVSSVPPVDEPYSFQRHIQTQPDYERLHPPSIGIESQTPAARSTIIRHSPLTTLLNSLPIPPSETTFLPAEEELPLPISTLPAELIDPILSHLDVASIERFGSTCWRARWLTSNSRVWKRIAEGIYRNPVVYPEDRDVGELAERHNGEWRSTFVEEERVRMDGCYISVCHYIRPGAGEEWVTITHLITYHRYLRFYPDGSVISFLTTDHPSEIVPILKPNLRAKGLHFGRWRLIRSDTLDVLPHSPEINNKKDTQTKRAKVMITELFEPGSQSPKYEFEMELGLRETGRGKWNKLDLNCYHSINLSTGESLALSLKHQKPFYFSKVKSYNPPL